MLQDENGNMFIKVGPDGATDYEEWDDGFGGYVTQIFIWHTDVIHGFQANYHRGGATVAGGMHGNNVGNFNAICLDGPLTSVSGRWGKACLDAELALNCSNDAEYRDEYPYVKVIKSLTFGTNTSTYGPFGPVKDKEFNEEFKYEAVTGICGFHAGPFGPVKDKEFNEEFKYEAATGICGFHGRCYKGSGGRNSYRDIPGPDGWIGGNGPNGWIGGFGVYVNATPPSNIGQASVTLMTDSVRGLALK